MKTKLTTFAMVLFMGVVSYAGCTVTTGCSTFNFPDESFVFANAQSTADGFLITITGSDGNVLATETCSSSSLSTRCGSGTPGTFEREPFEREPFFRRNICDILPPFLADFNGCN